MCAKYIGPGVYLDDANKRLLSRLVILLPSGLRLLATFGGGGERTMLPLPFSVVLMVMDSGRNTAMYSGPAALSI